MPVSIALHNFIKLYVLLGIIMADITKAADRWRYGVRLASSAPSASSLTKHTLRDVNSINKTPILRKL